MKKKNNLKKISVIFATALMAASAAGMSVSADSAATLNAFKGTKTVKTASKTTKKAKSTNSYGVSTNEEWGINLTSSNNGNAKPGDIIEVNLTLNSGNACFGYDVAIEYDSRLELAYSSTKEFEDSCGAQAAAAYDEDGKKMIGLVDFATKAYKDGTKLATILFRVPDDAENGNYEIKFDKVELAADGVMYEDDYSTTDAAISVTGGVERTGPFLELKDVTGMAGDYAVVQFIPTTGNKCAGYDLIVEYDSRLVLDESGISGANEFDIREEDGKNIVALVGYTPATFKDGKAMATLSFLIPNDATADDEFEVKLAEVNSFVSEVGDFEDYRTSDAVISVVAPKPGQKISEYKSFKKYAADGTLIASMVGNRGDSNNDGKTNVKDAANIAAAIASGKGGIDEMGEFFADVDDSGKLNVRDASQIAGYVARGSTSWDQ